MFIPSCWFPHHPPSKYPEEQIPSGIFSIGHGVPTLSPYPEHESSYPISFFFFILRTNSNLSRQLFDSIQGVQH